MPLHLRQFYNNNKQTSNTLAHQDSGNSMVRGDPVVQNLCRREPSNAPSLAQPNQFPLESDPKTKRSNVLRLNPRHSDTSPVVSY